VRFGNFYQLAQLPSATIALFKLISNHAISRSLNFSFLHKRACKLWLCTNSKLSTYSI